MITAFELKNRPCCRFFYKIPYFIKNLVLLAAMFLIIGLNYLVHYQMGELTVQQVQKLIAGLNSQTFTYLQTQPILEKLSITASIKKPSVVTLKQVDFYSTYVSRSRPAFLAGLAKSWPAFEKWRYKNDGHFYLSKLLGDTNVNVFLHGNPPTERNDDQVYQGFNFNMEFANRMPYSRQAVKEVYKNAVGATIRDSSLSTLLERDIIKPQFYDTIAEFSAIELTQAQFFIERAHYSHSDQFICMVDGSAHLRLVPHINWNAMYAGESILDSTSESSVT